MSILIFLLILTHRNHNVNYCLTFSNTLYSSLFTVVPLSKVLFCLQTRLIHKELAPTKSFTPINITLFTNGVSYTTHKLHRTVSNSNHRELYTLPLPMTLRHFPLVSVPAERARHKATVGRSAQGEGRRAAVDPSKGWPDNAAAGGYCCALTVATVSPHARLLRSSSECETQRGQLET